MKAVLISIQPKWCELIASGKKTVEVRKNKPKLETPFKIYIYMTKEFSRGINSSFYYYKNGKVIGEFVCDEIKKGTLTVSDLYDSIDIGCNETCLSVSDIKAYLGMKYVERKGDYTFYGWHISNLVIYDKPKELSEFRTLCKYRNEDGFCQYRKVECDCVKFDINPDYSVNLAECCDFTTRPPQSWCYVEVLQ